MKIIFVITTFCICMNFANAAPGEIIQTSIKPVSKWRFMVGSSKFENEYSSASTGMSFGAERVLVKHFVLGLAHGIYSKNQVNYTLTHAYLGAMPIQYTRGAFNFDALATVSPGYSNYQGGLIIYGAALDFGFNDQVGIRLERKMGNIIEAISTISLVGYY